MVWFFERETELLRLETRYDNDAAEFVAIVHWTSKPKQIERFSDATSFQTWLTVFEDRLGKERWRSGRPPEFVLEGWPLIPTKKPD